MNRTLIVLSALFFIIVCSFFYFLFSSDRFEQKEVVLLKKDFDIKKKERPFEKTFLKVEKQKIEENIKELSSIEIKEDIKLIDEEIEDHLLIEKANAGSLSVQEKEYLSDLLDRRNIFYKEDIERYLKKIKNEGV